MTPLVFVDCETTSLAPDRRPWEIALIRRDDIGERQRLMQVDLVDLSAADPVSLKFNRFYDRAYGYAAKFDDDLEVRGEFEVAESIESLTRGAYLIASNPAFDALTLDMMLRRNGLLPAWSYHLIDVRAMALGWLRGTAKRFPLPVDAKSDDIARACGIDPDSYERHTAMGDARMVRDWFDAITGGAK